MYLLMNESEYQFTPSFHVDQTGSGGGKLDYVANSHLTVSYCHRLDPLLIVMKEF